MAKQFIPPIELGQFAPSAAAISSWLYQVWKYLQDNPIPDTSDVERVTDETAQAYFAEHLPPEVAQQVAAAVAAINYNDIVNSDMTIPVYRASNDEISHADLSEAYDEGCRFAVVDDESVYVMLKDNGQITLLPINPVTSVNGQTGAVAIIIPTKTSDLTNDSGFITSGDIPVTSVNGQTGAVAIVIPTKTSDLTNDSGFVTAATAPVRSVNSQTGAVSLFIPTKTSELQNDAGFVTAAQAGGVVSVNGLTGIVVIPIPTKTSDLTNDSGFLTSAPVTSVNGQTGAVVITIPTKTSDLTNDSGFLTSAPVSSVNGQTGAVSITIPTKTSDLTNDSGFLTSAPVTSVNGRTGAVIVGNANSINLAVAGWNTTTKEMTVIATGVTANNVVIISPAPASFDEWGQCGVRCIAQANGQLTFYCDKIPDNALTANVCYL